MNSLKADAHLQALRSKHQQLDEKIHEEMGHPIPDSLVLKHLKQKKLAIKDEIVGLDPPT